MKFIAATNRLISIVADTLRQFFSWRIWVVLLGYYFLQWLVLLAHYQFTSPLLGWLASITLSFQDPQRAAAFTHYPAHLILLPGVFSWAKLGLGLLIEGAVFGYVATEFANVFGISPTTPRSFGSRWLQFLVVWIVINGLALLVAEVVPALVESKLYSPKRVAAFAFVAMPAIFTVCSMLFFYAFAVAAATGKNAFSALWQSLRLLWRNPMTTLVLALLVNSVPVLISAITGAYATTLVDKFHPELVYWLLAAGIVVEMISAFFWMGFSVRLLADESA